MVAHNRRWVRLVLYPVGVAGLIIVAASSCGNSPPNGGSATGLPGDADLSLELVSDEQPPLADDGASLPTEVRALVESAIVPGSIEGIGTLRSDLGTSRLYRWRTEDEPFDCVGVVQASFAETGCAATTSVFWSTTEGTNGTVFSALVIGLPADAERIQTLTEFNRVVEAPAIDGVSFVQWPAGEGSAGGLLPSPLRDFGDATMIAALDGESRIVWSERRR